MDKYAGLASLFDPSVGSGDAALDELIGLRPYSAREREEDRRRELADIEASMGGGEAGAMGGGGEQNLAFARRYLESRGVPAHIAAGAVGNFAQESGGIAGGALNKEGGLGIAQWRGERLYGGGGYEGLVPFAKRQGRSPQDLTTQLDYFISELQGPERSAFEKAMQTRTPEQAAVALGRYYERPNEQYANYGNRTAQARRFAAIPDEQIQNAPSGMYLDVTGGRPFQQRQAQQSQQPQLETVPMQLSTGQTINVEKGMTHEEVAAMLRKEGIEGAPLRPFQAPNGQTINVEYDMSDDEVLGMLRKEAPEYAVPQGSPAPDKSSYTAAAKEALLQGASGIATGLGGEIGELGKATTGAEFLGQYAKPIGEAITGAGESMRGYGEELGHRAEGVFEMPKDANWFEKNVGYPAVQTGAGIVPYAAAYAIPGVGPATGTAALYGGAMGGLEERAKETGKEFVPSEARPYAVGEAAIDYVGGRLLGPLKKLFSDDVVLGARETIIKAVEKGGIEEAKKVVGSRLGNIAKQVGITDAAFTSSEVAENVIERAYAGQPLFDDAALEEYANTAKQVAGFGGVAGAVQGLGRHHIKATEVARIEEQKATEAAVKAQEEAQQFKQEAANAQAAEIAKRKAERQPIEIPEELQGMPYEDAVRYMQMQRAKTQGPTSEAEAPVPETETPAPEAPISEAPIEEIPEPTVQTKPYYEQLGLKARKNSIILNGLKQLNPEDPTHGPAINAFLDEIEAKKMPRDQQAIDALRTKLSEVQQNAQQVPQAGPIYGGSSAQPGFRKEGGDQAISGEGMEPSRQGEQGAEGETTEKVAPVSIQNPDLGIVPLPIAEFESAGDAEDLLHRYEKIATDSQLHNLAKTYLASPHAASIKTIFFKRGDKIPGNVQKVFDVEKAGAATVIGEDGVRLYFRTDDPDSFSEDIVIHEVTHAMTEAALARNPTAQGELASLSDKISRVLFSNDPSLGDFWDNVLRKNPGETLAYGLTSPTFRKILSKYDEDGHRLKAKPSEFRGKAPEKLSLWDKFVDAIAKLFGFPTKRKEQFKRELNEYLSKKTGYEKQLSDYNAQRPMQAKLDSLLQELMKTTEAEGVAMPSETAVRAVTQEAPRRERGLAGTLKDKDFGEKLSEATRDILTSGRKTSLRSEWFDQSEALGKATENLPTMVGKKARVDFLASHVAQVGNVIADSIHNGFVKDVGDGSVMTIKDHNLAPEKIFRRVAETGKKELFNEMLVALRGRSIREADRKTKALADDLLTKADEMEEYASTLQDKKKQASFIRSADNLRTIAEKKLEGINYDKGRTEVSEEDIRKAEELERAEPELAREAQNVYELLRKSVDLLEDSGSIDAATAKQYREYPNYIPLYKEQDFEEAMIDPAKHLQLIISKMGRGANKLPEIKRQKAHFHEVMVESNILKHIAFCTMAAAKNNLNKAAALQMELVGAAEPSKLGKDDPDGVQFRDKGEVKYYTIKDKQALFALQAAQPLINPIFKQLKKVSGVVRGAMVMNPLFWYRQLVREPLTASLVGRTGVVTPFDTLAEIAKIAAGKSERYEDLKRRGVVAAQDVITDPIEFIKYVEKDKGWVSKGIERVKEIHEAVDGATRAVVAERAYQDAISKGYSEEDASNLAAIKAREIINFSKQGRSQNVRVMRATTPFFGAALNGLDVLAKAAMPKKYGRLSKAEAMEARRMFYSRAAMIALYTTAYTMASSDDEDYLSTVDRADNWLIPTGNKDNPFAKIAIPYELGFFLKTLPELITLMNMGAISTKKAVTEAGKSVWNTVVPPMPTIYAIKPLVEAYINYDFHTQSPIETGSDSRGMSYLKNKKAGELTKAIAEKLHDAGIDLETLSPDRMEQVLNGYLGQIWAVARTASDYALYDGPEKPEKILSDYPLIGGAVTKSARDAAVNDFYSVYGDVRALSESASKAEKTGDIQLLEKLRKDKEYAKYMKADTPLGDKMQAMDNKQQIIARIEKDPTIDAAEKKRRIDIQNEQRNTLAKQGLDIARKLGLEF